MLEHMAVQKEGDMPGDMPREGMEPLDTLTYVSLHLYILLNV